MGMQLSCFTGLFLFAAPVALRACCNQFPLGFGRQFESYTEIHLLSVDLCNVGFENTFFLLKLHTLVMQNCVTRLLLIANSLLLVQTQVETTNIGKLKQCPDPMLLFPQSVCFSVVQTS